jgi:hypothetical protein
MLRGRGRPRTLAASMVFAVALPFAISAAPATTQAADPPASTTANLQHVTTEPFPDIDGRRNVWAATDSDFLEFRIPGGDDAASDVPRVCQLDLPARANPAPCRDQADTGDAGATDASTFILPTPEENGGIDLPAGYSVQPGEVRHFNLMGTRARGLFVTDITDPTDPVVVARWDCPINQADVFTFQQYQEDGSVRQLVAYTQDALDGAAERDADCFQDIAEQQEEPLPASSRGTFIADVTDPYRPQTVSFLPMRKGTHQTTVHPSGNYVYNSAAVVQVNAQHLGSIEVYDVSTPEEPELVFELRLETGLDSHDMTFNEVGNRLYVAAISHSFIIDTTDPAEPQIIARILDPAVNIHHDAHAVTVDTPLGERTYLLLGDELGGATPTGVCPGGGVHVYDITGPLEAAPVKVGAFFAPEVRVTPADVGGLRTCTAHVIQVLPEQQLLVMAWYNAGVRILDYSGLADLGPAGLSVGAGGQTLTPGIQEIGHSRFADSSLWSAKVREVADDGSFYIFGGDMTRGLDIWHFSPDAPSAAEAGTWVGPDQVLSLPAAPGLAGGATPYCLIPAGR